MTPYILFPLLSKQLSMLLVLVAVVESPLGDSIPKHSEGVEIAATGQDGGSIRI
jgi:hypothetical protein